MQKCMRLENLQANIPILLTAVMLVISLLSIVIRLLGYKYVPYNGLVAYGSFTLIQAALCVYSFARRNVASLTARYFVLFLPIIALLYMGGTIVIMQSDTYIYLIPHYFIFYILCLVLLFVHEQKSKVLKIALGMLYNVILISLFCFCLLLIVLGNFTQETITKTIPSPNNTYTAIIIKSDQGALGSDTFIGVEYTKKEKKLVFGKHRKSQRIYSGDGELADYLPATWQYEETLLIFDVPYNIVW